MTREQFENKYVGKNGKTIAVHCNTLEKAEKLLKIAYKLRYKWLAVNYIKKEYISESCWDVYKDETYYKFDFEYGGRYGCLEQAKDYGYAIVEFEDEPVTLTKEISPFNRDSIDNRGGMIYTSGGSNFLSKRKVDTHVCPHCHKSFEEIKHIDMNWNL